MTASRAVVTAGSSAAGGLTGAVLTGAGQSGLTDVLMTLLLALIGIFVSTALAIAIVAVVAGIRATFAGTPETRKTALTVFTTAIDALRAFLWGCPAGGS
ncbi:hypothetical protein [Nocardia nova]|uniref:hypothetical protein n=1 Tax=Nocardia nova TaxID=37330 RepID=UPI0011B088A0|nr:hypothetical protein [Nocardia nova]